MFAINDLLKLFYIECLVLYIEPYLTVSGVYFVLFVLSYLMDESYRDACASLIGTLQLIDIPLG